MKEAQTKNPYHKRFKSLNSTSSKALHPSPGMNTTMTTNANSPVTKIMNSRDSYNTKSFDASKGYKDLSLSTPKNTDALNLTKSKNFGYYKQMKPKIGTKRPQKSTTLKEKSSTSLGRSTTALTGRTRIHTNAQVSQNVTLREEDLHMDLHEDLVEDDIKEDHNIPVFSDMRKSMDPGSEKSSILRKTNLSEYNQNIEEQSFGRSPNEDQVAFPEYMDDYFARNGFYNSMRGNKEVNINKKTASKGDSYYATLEKFIDQTLKVIALKISEKKDLDFNNVAMTVKLNDLEKEDTKIAGQCDEFINGIRVAVEKNAELENDIKELTINLKKTQEKSDQAKEELDKQRSEINRSRKEMNDLLDQKKNSLQELREVIQSEKHKINTELKNLDNYAVDLENTLIKLRKKAEYSKNLEKNRISLIKEKTKVLESLIMNEQLTEFNSKVSIDIHKILVSPVKRHQRSISTMKGNGITTIKHATIKTPNSSKSRRHSKDDAN